MAMDAAVSEVLLETCRLRRQPEVARFVSWCCAGDGGVDSTHLTGGFGDLDIDIASDGGECEPIHVVQCRNDAVVMPSGHRAYQRLPGYFADKVDLYAIGDARLSHGISLNYVGQLKKLSPDGSSYDFLPKPASETSQSGSDTESVENNLEGHEAADGKSIRFRSALAGQAWRTHVTPCIRCMEWPLQAADWPTRSRQHGWPKPAAIDLAVRNGCDLLRQRVRHRTTDRPEGAPRSWKLSFSRAEIVLMSGWTPTQQLLFHMIRRLVKTTDAFRSCVEAERQVDVEAALLKALFLSLCETKSSAWWRNSNLVRTSGEIIRHLAECIRTMKLFDYFATSCHLLDRDVYSVDQEDVVSRIDPDRVT